MKLRKLYFFILTLTVTVSCSENESVDKITPTSFTLAQIKSFDTAGRMVSAIQEESGFDLGELRASKEFYFLLGSTENKAVFNIELESSNPQFTISPRKISALNSDDGSQVIPMLSLGVLHGIRLNGVGYTDLLPMGPNSTTITIRGKVLADGDSVDITAAFDMVVNARQMDIALYSGESAIDFSNPVAQSSGLEYESELTAIPVYLFDPANLKIKNTGNVSVTLAFTHLTSGNDTIRMTLEPNQIESVTLPPPIFADYVYALIHLDGGGAITNRSRIKQGVDGKGYLVIQEVL